MAASGGRDLPLVHDVLDLVVGEPGHVRVERAAEGRDQDRHADRGAELAGGVQHARGQAEVLAGHRAHRAHVQRREADPHPDADHQQPGQDADVGPRVVRRGRQEGHPQHPDRHHDQCRLRELAGRPRVRRASHERPRDGPHSGIGTIANAASSCV